MLNNTSIGAFIEGEIWEHGNGGQLKSRMNATSRADFHFFKRRGGKISSGVQAAPLSVLRQGLGIQVRDFHTK
jgi:hypothetical protein